jgi:hypothetical protein
LICPDYEMEISSILAGEMEGASLLLTNGQKEGITILEISGNCLPHKKLTYWYQHPRLVVWDKAITAVYSVDAVGSSGGFLDLLRAALSPEQFHSCLVASPRGDDLLVWDSEIAKRRLLAFLAELYSPTGWARFIHTELTEALSSMLTPGEWHDFAHRCLLLGKCSSNIEGIGFVISRTCLLHLAGLRKARCELYQLTAQDPAYVPEGCFPYHIKHALRCPKCESLVSPTRLGRSPFGNMARVGNCKVCGSEILGLPFHISLKGRKAIEETARDRECEMEEEEEEEEEFGSQ